MEIRFRGPPARGCLGSWGSGHRYSGRMTDPLAGLDEAAVRDRVLRGEVNEVPRAASRTVWEIVRSNLFTPFNALLGTLFVVILAVGAPQDALFGIVLVANTAIGIFQELRAKRTLDRLAVLTAPRARVVRTGRIGEISVGDVVLDDVLELRPGDQVVVDGSVLASAGLELDESLLSGESEPLVKEPGAEPPTRVPWRSRPSASPWCARSSGRASTASSST